MLHHTVSLQVCSLVRGENPSTKRIRAFFSDFELFKRTDLSFQLDRINECPSKMRDAFSRMEGNCWDFGTKTVRFNLNHDKYLQKTLVAAKIENHR